MSLFFFFFACTEYLPLNWARTCVWDGDSTCPPAPSCSPCPGLEAGPGRRPAACRSAGRYSAPGIAPRTSDSAAAETLAPTPPWSPWGAEAPTFHSPTPLTALRFLPRHRLFIASLHGRIHPLPTDLTVVGVNRTGHAILRHKVSS